MEFKLTYEGPLWAKDSQKRAPDGTSFADHKQHLRRAFDLQLRVLWNTNVFLKEAQAEKKGGVDTRQMWRSGAFFGPSAAEREPLADALKRRHAGAYVPMVCSYLDLSCDLEIDALVVKGEDENTAFSDFDNRIKTLIDGLRKPKNKQELGQHSQPPEDGVLFVLMEDDNRIRSLSTKSSRFLEEHNDVSFAKIWITVRTKCSPVTFLNAGFL
ncbi:MAG: hypothetical protein AAF318_19050 [Pseudomonadota bacterium]